MGIGVHLTHCCVIHGCKYGDKDCPVADGTEQQEYCCETCDVYDKCIKTPSKLQHKKYRVKAKGSKLYTFTPNDPVWVNWHNVCGSGRVVGVATIEQPILGSMFIVKMDDPKKAGIDQGVYPFDTLAIPEIALVRILEKD